MILFAVKWQERSRMCFCSDAVTSAGFLSSGIGMEWNRNWFASQQLLRCAFAGLPVGSIVTSKQDVWGSGGDCCNTLFRIYSQNNQF